MYNEDEEVLLDERRLNDVDGKVIANSDVNKLIELIGETSKYKYGIELLKKLCAENKQVIVWGIFVDTLRNISKSLNVLNISNHVICGATNHEEREELIKKFKNKEYQVLITNPHTLAESVSLHQNCHDAVYFEYSFNLTHMLQSRDRINRLGLLDSDYTQYYYLTLCNDDIYNDSIDKKTLKRLNEKEEIMLQSIEGTRLTNIEFDDIDDIRKILNDI